jgi:hypothetical protein
MSPNPTLSNVAKFCQFECHTRGGNQNSGWHGKIILEWPRSCRQYEATMKVQVSAKKTYHYRSTIFFNGGLITEFVWSHLDMVDMDCSYLGLLDGLLVYVVWTYSFND